jgi:hypothetical protein
MWIFTRYGFFSAVCARQADGRHGRPVDPDRIMVRARVRIHLEQLQARFPALIGELAITESRDTDYAFRLIVAKGMWSELLGALGAEIDYDNFKSEVAAHQGRAGAKYEHALHEVWSVMRRLQG